MRVVSNDKLINALRSLDYTFKRQADRVMLYRQRGGTKRVAVRRRDLHDEDYVRVVLRQAGMPDENIELFIRSCNH